MHKEKKCTQPLAVSTWVHPVELGGMGDLRCEGRAGIVAAAAAAAAAATVVVVWWQSHPIMCAGNDFIRRPCRSPVPGNCVCAGDWRQEWSAGRGRNEPWIPLLSGVWWRDPNQQLSVRWAPGWRPPAVGGQGGAGGGDLVEVWGGVGVGVDRAWLMGWVSTLVPP